MRRNEMTLPILEKHSRGVGNEIEITNTCPNPIPPNLFCITSDFNQGQSH